MCYYLTIEIQLNENLLSNITKKHFVVVKHFFLETNNNLHKHKIETFLYDNIQFMKTISYNLN